MNVIWYGNHEGMYRGWWDMTIFEDFFSSKECIHFEGFVSFHQSNVNKLGAIVIIPGRALVGKEAQVQKDISTLEWCLLIVAGDEEAGFDIDAVTHPNMIVWVQYPKMGKHDKYNRIPCGYTPGTEKVPFFTKSLDWAFLGQVTHVRRHGAVEAIKELPNGYLLQSAGFTQGLEHQQYLNMLATAKSAPCPSGPETPDTFRVCEALELGCVPIADEVTPKFEAKGYWEWMFGVEVPFPTYTNPEFIPGHIEHVAQHFPAMNNAVQSWWINTKRRLKNTIFTQAELLGAEHTPEDITVIIPVSPIPSHPDTTILEESIKSVRYHLPTSPIILTFDGIRPEQEKFRSAYEEHIRRVLWLSKQWGDVMFKIFEEHTHQVGMARWALEQVDTPMVLYVEQDTPIVTDEPIDWTRLKSSILSGESNVIRFHFEAHIPKVHEYLMIGPVENNLRKTVQWSQRPHLALTNFYRQVIRDHFSADARCFIEDLLHGKIQQYYQEFGTYGWNMWKLHIYCPNTTNIKRSYHTDGRAGEAKFDGDQVW